MRKYLWRLAELTIWGLVLFSTLFVSLYIYNKNTREKHTYYVFFNDVDGLIKGSPVKIQGYQVGYVSNISIVNEDVFITFIITDKELIMPKNLAATVEFTGMGGSKSLELYVPKQKLDKKNYITAIEPKRLQDFYVYQTQIAQNIVSMTTDFMNIYTPHNEALLRKFIKKPDIIQDIHRTLDDMQNAENQYMENRRKNENKNIK